MQIEIIELTYKIVVNNISLIFTEILITSWIKGSSRYPVL